MALFRAEDLTAPEFSRLVTARTVGVLPIAAIEPHGPHLPLSTDCDIAVGHLTALSGCLVGETDVVVLPLQQLVLEASLDCEKHTWPIDCRDLETAATAFRFSLR